jgi:hypothetical protein
MLQTIIDAIRNHQVLAFSYSGLERLIEPHAVGISRAGNQVLRCYQIRGGHITPGHDWDLCELEKIRDLRITGSIFLSPRPGYKRGDRHMTEIYAQL